MAKDPYFKLFGGVYNESYFVLSTKVNSGLLNTVETGVTEAS